MKSVYELDTSWAIQCFKWYAINLYIELLVCWHSMKWSVFCWYVLGAGPDPPRSRAVVGSGELCKLKNMVHCCPKKNVKCVSVWSATDCLIYDSNFGDYDVIWWWSILCVCIASNVL